MSLVYHDAWEVLQDLELLVMHKMNKSKLEICFIIIVSLIYALIPPCHRIIMVCAIFYWKFLNCSSVTALVHNLGFMATTFRKYGLLGCQLFTVLEPIAASRNINFF
jgi:hypothetical protein